MSQPAKAQEPSMEEILASIRRIISDDDGAKPAAAPEPPKAVEAPRPPMPSPVESKAMNQSAVDSLMSEPAPAPAKPAAKPEPAAPDILDLTEAMAAPPPPVAPASNFRTIDGESDIVFSDRPPEAPAAEPAARPAERPLMPAMPDRNLLSNATTAAVDNAFNTLAQTVLGNSSRTLEDLVKEMLRPMLKSWLDDNLPNLVERIVRAEIERVSRGR